MTPRAFAVSAGAAWVDGARFKSPFPAVDLPTLVDRISKAATSRGRSQQPGVVLVVADDALPLLGLPPALGPGAELEAAPEAARAAGWRVPALSYWTSFWASGRPSVHMVVPAWQGDYSGSPLLDPDDLAATTTRLALYAEYTGAPFRLSPGVAALGSIRDGRPWRRAPYWVPSFDRMGKALAGGEAHLVWRSPEPAPGHPHRYDANLAYLAAAALADLAGDQLQRTKAPEFDPRQAGYWLIEEPTWNRPLMPSPVAGVPAGDRGRRWVCTPTLGLLHELAADGDTSAPSVLEAWTAPASRRLRNWAEQLRDAFAELDGVEQLTEDEAAVRSTLKATFREGWGMLAHQNREVYRPDWHHAVQSQARISLWRRMWAIGKAEDRWPAAVDVDCVTYPAADPDPVAACPKGLTIRPGLGGFKVYGDARTAVPA